MTTFSHVVTLSSFNVESPSSKRYFLHFCLLRNCFYKYLAFTQESIEHEQEMSTQTPEIALYIVNIPIYQNVLIKIYNFFTNCNHECSFLYMSNMTVLLMCITISFVLVRIFSFFFLILIKDDF